MKFYLRLLMLAILIPAPATAQDRTALVASVKADLVSRGVDISGPCGAFAIAKRVAWILRSEGFGYLWKGGGTNCEGFATDYLIQLPSGVGVDLLGDGGGLNIPQWSLEDAPDMVARNLQNWRAPVDPGNTPSPSPGPVVVTPPQPVPPSIFTDPEIIRRLAVIENKLDETKAVVNDAHAIDAQTLAEIQAHRAALKAWLLNMTKYVAPAIAALFAGRAM